MRKIVKLSLAGIAAIGLAGPVLAEEPGKGEDASKSSQDSAPRDAPPQRTGGHSKGAFMADYDANGDGKVSNAEFVAKRAEKYRSFDLNADGKVEEAEYVGEYEGRLDRDLAERRERQVKQAHVRYNVLDSDEDKNMTFDEFNVSGARMFSRLDSNEDGVVDARDTAEHF